MHWWISIVGAAAALVASVLRWRSLSWPRWRRDRSKPSIEKSGEQLDSMYRHMADEARLHRRFPKGKALDQETIDAAVRAALGAQVSDGTLGMQVPPLRQGRRDVVSVAIGRGADAAHSVRALIGPETPTLEAPIRTTVVMTVDPRGDSAAFCIEATSDREQVVPPAALWEFDVIPYRAGLQTLTVVASMVVFVPGRGDARRTIPSLRREVQVQVDRVYSSRAFLVRNWKWIGTTAVAIAAVAVPVLVAVGH